jgi:hypothetical protein
MYDRELVLADLKNIIWALEQIQKRFAAITVPEDFTKDDTGLEKSEGVTGYNHAPLF